MLMFSNLLTGTIYSSNKASNPWLFSCVVTRAAQQKIIFVCGCEARTACAMLRVQNDFEIRAPHTNQFQSLVNIPPVQ